MTCVEERGDFKIRWEELENPFVNQAAVVVLIWTEVSAGPWQTPVVNADRWWEQRLARCHPAT